MIHPINHLPAVIRVGIQTESGVEEIGFDLSPWLTRWPGMTCAVWPTRPGESAAYPAANVEMVGNVLYWYPSSADTEKEGAGTVEVVGVVADKCKTTGPIDTLVKRTSLDVTQETPEPIVPWFEALQKTGGIAQQGAAEAAASAAEADEMAAEAGQHAATAGQYSANADAQAQEAKGHAEAAATSAENAEKAKQAAIDNADDAEEAAKSAQEWAGRAETFAGSAGTAADAAATSAQAAASSASSAETSAQAASESAQSAAKSAEDVKDVVDAGDSGLVLVTCSMTGVSSHTQEEVRAAVKAGKTCIFVEYKSGAVFDYYGEASRNGEMCPMFVRYGYEAGNGIIQYKAFIAADGYAYRVWGAKGIKTPNPYGLTFTGAVKETYDGSGAVTVNIPQGGGGGGGLPETAEPNSQLVTDADGKVVWAPREDDSDAVAVQADMAQNDAAAPDYIKNRTHYFRGGYTKAQNTIVPEDAVWSPIRYTNQANPFPGYEMSNPRCYKIADITPEMEEILRGCVLTKGATGKTEITADLITNVTESGYTLNYSFEESWFAFAVCFESGYRATRGEYNQGDNLDPYMYYSDLPEPGLYAVCGKKTDGSWGTYYGFDWADYYKPLDDKYISDNIARKEDIPNLDDIEIPEPVTDDHINGLIDDKLEGFAASDDEHINGLIDDKLNTFGRVNLPETVVSMSAGQGVLTTPWAAPIVAGKTYKVIVNGEARVFTATPYAAADVPEGVIILGTEEGGGVMYLPDDVAAQMGITGAVMLPGLTGEITLAIETAGAGYYYFDGTTAKLVTIKELRAALDAAGGGVILEKTTVDGEDRELYLATPLSGTPEAGSTYTVMYNGTAYDCPAIYYEEEGLAGVMLGNTDAMGMPGGNTDAPFLMLLMPAGADMGDGTMLYGMVVAMDGSSSVTLSIVEAGGVVEYDSITLKDSVTAKKYALTVADGKLTMTEVQ